MLTRYNDNVVSLRKKIIRLILNSDCGFIHMKDINLKIWDEMHDSLSTNT